MKIIKGDLIRLAKKGKFDVIAHGCNCFCTQKSGIAKQMVKEFDTDSYNLELNGKGDCNKLGQIDYKKIYEEKEYFGGKWVYYPDEKEFMTGKSLIIVNCYTQYKYGTDKNYLDYEALTLCMRKINHIFKGKKIGLPWIGCGLAGGDKNKVLDIFVKELMDVDLTIVEL